MKLPLPLIIGLLGLLAVYLLFVFRPQSSKSLVTASSGILAAQSVNQSSNELDQKTVYGNVQAQKPIAQTNPKYWQLSQIATIKSTGYGTSIVFIDGSQELVNDFLLSQVPGSIRLRLEYSDDY
ncbi:MAG: hypothetical protein KC422_25070 [Trueperaceae bacterium]|nr:hypothetical protein [Trueperaceae bacterium]